MFALRQQADRRTRPFTAVLVIASLVAASIATFGWAPATAADTVPTIASDQPDYLPGATVNLTGSGWQPSELVHIVVIDSTGATARDVTVSADATGAITDSFVLPQFFVPTYDVTATGTADPPDVATTSFTDLPIGTFDQCSNDLGTGFTTGDTGCQWTGGVLNPSNSTYSEGDATVQRLWLINLLPGTSHTLTLTYDTTEGGIHAYDFLTTWNESEGWITSDDRCQGITGCTLAPTESTVDIPADPNVPSAFQPSAPGDRQFVMRGGALVSATTPALISGSYAGNSTTSISVTFNVDPGTGAMCSTDNHGVLTCGVALWFGAHVAVGTPDWGSGLGAANVSGAPYHVSLGGLDGASLGNRANGANGMQGAEMPSGSLTLGKSLSGGPVGYSGPFTIHYDCGGTSTGDVSVSAGDSTSVPGLPAGAVCTVTEPTLPSPPTGYSFGSPSFTDSSGTPDDGIVTIESGADVAVTTNNTLTRDTGTLTIAKTLSNPDGAPVPSSFTIDYDCGTGFTGSRSVAAGGTATVSGIPTGNTCTVSEAALAPITGYTWAAPTYSPASIVISDTTSNFTLTVGNSITRDRGTLTIAKTLSNPDGAPVPSSFTINYNCGTGYTGSRSVAAGGTATVSGIPTGNTCSVTEAALAPIAGYAWAAPTYSPASIVISNSTSTFTLTVANSIRRDNTPPACSLTGTNPGPPTVIQVTTSDGGSGLKTIVVTNLVNATVSIPAFTVGSTAPVAVSATKTNQSIASELALQVTDVAGNVTNCDPVVSNVVGPVVAQTFTNVSSAEHVLTVINGSPGLGTAVAIVNGTTFTMTGLKAGERRTIDVGSAMTAGSANTIKVYGVGKSGSSATIVIWDGIGTIT